VASTAFKGRLAAAIGGLITGPDRRPGPGTRDLPCHRVYVYSYIYPDKLDGSYDADVPNKTIYVSDGDLKLFERAQELAGGNLSAAIAKALRRYVDIEDGRRDGYDEVTVRVGPKAGRKVRFSGVLLGTWGNNSTAINVYRSRSGKFVIHTVRTADWTTRDADGKPAGWRGWLGIGDFTWVGTTGESTLDVVDTVEELRERLPPELFDVVAVAPRQPAVEDLDI
jgi:EXLDI family protein